MVRLRLRQRQLNAASVHFSNWAAWAEGPGLDLGGGGPGWAWAGLEVGLIKNVLVMGLRWGS